MRTAIASFVLVMSLGVSLAAQTTLFTTEDYRRDQARWTDPAYYLYNTARQLTDMQVENRFGQKGSADDKYDIKSPYPFRTSREHYDAWLEKANREYYVQMAKAEAEGRHWWAASFCLPDGFLRGVSRSPQQFVIRPNQVVMLTDTLISTQVRWVHTDKGHRPEAQQFPQWLGESIGFWDGNALVVHTNQIRQWTASHSLFEWSDQMTTVERYERVGNEIVGEITFYGLQHVYGHERAVQQHLRKAGRHRR